MEGGARWSHWYSVQVRRPRNQPEWHDNQPITEPNIAHGRNHVLMWEWLSTGGGCALYKHTATNDTSNARGGTLEISKRNQAGYNGSPDYDRI
jgi:hypothetical protein